MKKIFLMLIAGVCAASMQAQTDSIRITGRIDGKVGIWRTSKATFTAQDYQTVQTVPVAMGDTVQRFRFALPKATKQGVYRMMPWDTEIIIDGKETEITYAASRNSLQFSASEQNKAWQAYKEQSGARLQKIASLEKSYTDGGKTDKQMRAQIMQERKMYQQEYTDFCNRHAGTVAGRMVKNNPRRFADPDMNTVEQKQYVHFHLWEGIDPADPVLLNTPLYADLMSQYIYYYAGLKLDEAAATDSLNKATDKIISVFGEKEESRNYAIKQLEQMYASNGNLQALRYLDENYRFEFCEQCGMDGGDEKMRDSLYQRRIEGYRATANGMPAADIRIRIKNDTVGLKDLQGGKIAVMFWSLTCSHCMDELPKIDESLQTDSTLTVVAVCLSSDSEEDKYNELRYKYPHPRYVFDNKSWDSPLVQSYYVTATPTFFILDKNRNFAGIHYKWADTLKALKE